LYTSACDAAIYGIAAARQSVSPSLTQHQQHSVSVLTSNSPLLYTSACYTAAYQQQGLAVSEALPYLTQCQQRCMSEAASNSPLLYTHNQHTMQQSSTRKTA
jgi:hypothetical protein